MYEHSKPLFYTVDDRLIDGLDRPDTDRVEESTVVMSGEDAILSCSISRDSSYSVWVQHCE